MGFLDRLFGTDQPQQAPPPPRAGRAAPERTDDEIAVERYRYLLRTAPPETIEQVHREAFAKLSDEQRAMIYEELSRGAQTGERPLSSEPDTLARAATRAELRQPGTMERAFGGMGGAQGARSGPGFGSLVAGSLLGTVAGYVIGSALVSAFLPYDAGSDQSGADGSGEETGSDGGDNGSDASADGGVDGGDSWGGGGDSFGGGGDFGGGDFGGGDFGGGDFGGF